MIRVLNAAETSAALPYPHLIAEIEKAAQEMAAGLIQAPARLSLELGAGDNLLCMPVAGKDLAAVKVVTVHPSNPERGLRSIQGELLVSDIATGRKRMLLDGFTATGRRTAAVSLLGIKLFTASPTRSVMLIGTGAQALFHAEALLEMFDLEQLFIASRSRDKAEAMACELGDGTGKCRIVAEALSTLSPEAMAVDVAVALTTARDPVVPLGISARTLVIGSGAFRADMAELPAELLRIRPIIVDTLEGARHEAGDLIRADIAWDKVVELSTVLEGAPREGPIPIFKTVGHASWDLAAARLAARSTNLLEGNGH